MSTILIKQDWSDPKKFLASQEAGGKKKNRVAGGWIADLCAQKKVITLCPLCTHKFSPSKLGYRKEKEFPICQAKCDGCSTWDPRCSWYVYDEIYTQVRSTADERRALAKWREQAIKKGSLEWQPAKF